MKVVRAVHITTTITINISMQSVLTLIITKTTVALTQ